jgi:sulfatase modifying factor 1
VLTFRSVFMFALLGALVACEEDTQPRPTPPAGPSVPTVQVGPSVVVPPVTSAISEPTSPVPADDSIRSRPLAEQRAYVLGLLREQLGVAEPAIEKLGTIFEASDWMGFGNPRISVGALSRAECRARRTAARVVPSSPECKAPNMVLVPGEDGAPGVCVDQFEFPNVACEFPFVWVRASEAQQICQAMDKRLCDAHEWEGGCAGRVLEPQKDYAWGRLPKAAAPDGIPPQ